MAKHSEFMSICDGFSKKLRYILEVKRGLKQPLDDSEEMFLFRLYKTVREDDYYDGLLDGSIDNNTENELTF